MSSLRRTLREEAEVRFEKAETAEDWRGNYIWAVYHLFNTNCSANTLHNLLYGEGHVPDKEEFKAYLHEFQKISVNPKYAFPDFMNNDEDYGDPVFDKVLLDDEEMMSD